MGTEDLREQSRMHGLLQLDRALKNGWKEEEPCPHLVFDVAEHEQKHDDQACPVLAMDAMNQDGIIV